MRSILILAAALLVATPAAAATSSADLEALAKTLEANPAQNSALDKQLLTALREPAKTLEGRDLGYYVSKDTGTIDTALKLMPAGFVPQVWEHPSEAKTAACSSMIAFWQQDGLKMETFAWGAGNCPSVLSAAIARGWAWKLKQVGR